MVNPDNFVVLIDTREQHPLAFNECATERTTLATGDYSCIYDGEDLREIVSIERKNVSDLLGCIGGDLRAAANAARCVAVQRTRN